MAIEIKLPPLSENVTEGGVLELRVKAGDTVNAGDVIAVIEAEKSTLEIAADQSGKVTELLVKKGDTVKVGQPLVRRHRVGSGHPAGTCRCGPFAHC